MKLRKSSKILNKDLPRAFIQKRFVFTSTAKTPDYQACKYPIFLLHPGLMGVKAKSHTLPCC